MCIDADKPAPSMSKLMHRSVDRSTDPKRAIARQSPYPRIVRTHAFDDRDGIITAAAIRENDQGFHAITIRLKCSYDTFDMPLLVETWNDD
jgi:hypothetical protein